MPWWAWLLLGYVIGNGAGTLLVLGFLTRVGRSANIPP
jgi:hypothetical protein